MPGLEITDFSALGRARGTSAADAMVAGDVSTEFFGLGAGRRTGKSPGRTRISPIQIAGKSGAR